MTKRGSRPGGPDAVGKRRAASLIRTLGVKEFKSLKHVEVELGLVNVFVGANGAGKSNLLEAIGIIGAAASGRIDDNALLRRGVRPGVPEVYKSAFRRQRTGDKLANAIEIKVSTGEADATSYRINITNPIHNPGPWWVFQHEEVTADGERVASRGPRNAQVLGERQPGLDNRTSVGAVVRGRAPLALRALLDALDDYAVFAPVTPVLRGIAPDSAPRSPVGLFGGQLPEAVAMLLDGQGSEAKQAFLDDALRFVDWASGFDVAEPSRAFIAPSVPTTRMVIRFFDRYMRPERNQLSGYDASEGALYILFMLVLALHDHAPRVFAVDNFDQALNPRAAQGLAKVFASAVLAQGRQALLTTHNPKVLDGLPLDDDRVRLFTVEREDNGHTQVRRVDVRDLRSLKQKHGNDAVSRLWLEGRLGGMAGPPDV